MFVLRAVFLNGQKDSSSHHLGQVFLGATEVHIGYSEAWYQSYIGEEAHPSH